MLFFIKVGVRVKAHIPIKVTRFFYVSEIFFYFNKKVNQIKDWLVFRWIHTFSSDLSDADEDNSEDVKSVKTTDENKK